MKGSTGWPGEIIRQLREQLPPGYIAEPLVRLGCAVDSPFVVGASHATPHAATVAPVVALEAEADEEYEYEVRIYDAERERTLVAAIEVVSPADKDRPRSRNAFVTKCAELVRRGGAVSIVDLITVKNFNLYAELMTFVGHGKADQPCANPPPMYATSARLRERVPRALDRVSRRPKYPRQELNL